MESLFPVITICGSSKFKEKHQEIAARLTLEGYIVLGMNLFNHAEDRQLDELTKDMLDRMHMAKIDMSTAIYVIDQGGYIGESTRNEIKYANDTGKTVYYMSSMGGFTVC